MDTVLELLLVLGRLFDVVSAELAAAGALRRAAKAGDLALIQKILDGDTDKWTIDKADKWGHTALMEATERGHIECIDELLRQGANVNAANAFGYSVRRNTHAHRRSLAQRAAQ